MKRKKVVLILCFLMALFFTTNAKADELMIDIWANIDHIDTLYIDDNTLQWHWGGSYNPAGETRISTFQNGTQVLNDVVWNPVWSASPLSDVFTGLSPAFLSNVTSFDSGALHLYDVRGDVIVDQWPAPGNGYEMQITFYDAPSPVHPDVWYAGAYKYHIGVQVSYTPAAPVPIPAAAWLLGSGLLGMAAVRRRMKK